MIFFLSLSLPHPPHHPSTVSVRFQGLKFHRSSCCHPWLSQESCQGRYHKRPRVEKQRAERGWRGAGLFLQRFSWQSGDLECRELLNLPVLALQGKCHLWTLLWTTISSAICSHSSTTIRCFLQISNSNSSSNSSHSSSSSTFSRATRTCRAFKASPKFLAQPTTQTPWRVCSRISR